MYKTPQVNEKTKVLKMKHLTKMLQVSAASILRWEGEGTFPKHIKLGNASIGWRVTDIDEWLKNRDGSSKGHAIKVKEEIKDEIKEAVIAEEDIGKKYIGEYDVFGLANENISIYSDRQSLFYRMSEAALASTGISYEITGCDLDENDEPCMVFVCKSKRFKIISDEEKRHFSFKINLSFDALPQFLSRLTDSILSIGKSRGKFLIFDDHRSKWIDLKDAPDNSEIFKDVF